MAGERVMSAISPLAVEVQEYLRDRRRLGFSLAREGTQLMAFARFADSQGYDGTSSKQQPWLGPSMDSHVD